MAILDVTDQNFEQETSEGLVLADFWAPWCGPCRMIAPILEELSEEMKPELTIVKLNVDENPQSPSSFGIQGIPTMILFKDGVPVEKIVGFQPKEVLKKQLMEKINEK